MSRKIIGGFISLVALGVLFAILWGLIAQPWSAAQAQTGTSDEDPQRERSTDPSDPNAPEISFIDNPTAQCFRPQEHTDSCYIQWNYFNVTASSSQYIISMTVTIDDRLRAYYSGFFQSSMYVPQEMQKPGFQVSCGLPGSSGVPEMGKTYSYAVRARETGGLKAANYGSVTCPADVVPVNELALSGPTQGFVGVPYDFTAAVSPVTATLPVEYLWQVTGQSTLTATQGLNHTRTFTWTSPGVKSISVEATNAGGSASANRNIKIMLYHLFLPLAERTH